MPTLTATTSPSLATPILATPIAFGGRPIETISDDDCLALLAEAVDEHDATHLDEVASLIGRLAIPIEL